MSSTKRVFHNWSHPQMFCRHQTVLETQPTTSSNYYNTTSICKAYIFLAYWSRRSQQKFFRID